MANAINWGDLYEAAMMRRVVMVYNEALKKALANQRAFLDKVQAVADGAIRPPAGYTDAQAARWRQGFLRELMRQQNVVDSIMNELNAAGVDVSEIIQDGMAEVYAKNREETVAAISGAVPNTATVSASFSVYDGRYIRATLTETLPPFSKIAYKHLGQNTAIRRKLQNEMSISILNGESQQKMAERIRAITGQTAKQARRVAQTERTRIQSQARSDAIHEAAEMGIRVTKTWSTRMRNSRDTHVALNGQTVLDGEKFISISGAELEYPGDPNAPAAEVINCHCVIVPGVSKVNAPLVLKNSRENGIIDYSKAVFATTRLFEKHVKKHGEQYPDVDEYGYVQIARDILSAELSDDIEEIERSDGGISRYRYSTNDFVATTKFGQIRTLFKPDDAAEYWRREHGRNK